MENPAPDRHGPVRVVAREMDALADEVERAMASVDTDEHDDMVRDELHVAAEQEGNR
jgi:hypothetical protein